MTLSLLALGITAFWLVALAMLILGFRQVKSLEELPPLAGDPPRVSLVVAARNEGKHIGKAMQSLLSMDYPDLEIIAVDDRSTDGTGNILDEMAREDARLDVVHVRELPEGWLGKLNAMQAGLAQSTGELLLFADGDVYFHADALSRAVRYLQDNRLDHLCSVPRLINTHWSMRMMVPVFSVFLFLQARPWKVQDPESSAHMGVGAFNLVSRHCLETIGGFEPIRLRPDDDVKLGKLVKQHGFRQGFVDAGGMLEVEWYHDAAEMIRGLEKNSFAFLDYSVPRMTAASLAVATVCLWPLAGLWVGSGPGQALHLVSLGIMALLGSEILARQSLGRITGLLFPLGGGLMVVAMLNSMIQTLRQGGIRWRGTLYPMEQLRRNRL